MKILFTSVVIMIALVTSGQNRINPVIKNAGGVFEVPDALEKPDTSLVYKIVIELFSESDTPREVNQALNNVARLINLHVSGGVPKENLDVVVAIHGEATYTLTDSRTYEKKFKSSNPNLVLYNELSENGVKLFVCGQSLLARGIERSVLIPQVKIATSMLTTVTTHQLRGYAFLRF